MSDENENIEDAEAEELSLEELVRANYPKRVADKFLEEFDDLPACIADLQDSTMSGGEYYDYVKQCIADNHKVPSAVDYCSRFIKDGKYVFESVAEEDFDKFIHSDELADLVQF